MRKCGVCVFGGRGQKRGPPSAACVLVFSCASMEGPGGVLAQVKELAADKPIAMASAYCKTCRAITWLCREGVDLSTACVDFRRQLRTTQNILLSLEIMRENNRSDKARLRVRTARRTAMRTYRQTAGRAWHARASAARAPTSP